MGEEDEGDDICAKVWTRPLIKRGVGEQQEEQEQEQGETVNWNNDGWMEGRKGKENKEKKGELQKGENIIKETITDSKDYVGDERRRCRNKGGAGAGAGGG